MSFPKGYFAGWRDYRHGVASSGNVYVPGKAMPKQARNKQSREHMVAEAKRILSEAVASPFEFEGACRHGIRSGLCLDGADWHTADDVAAYAVGEALHRLGARRPSWEEGQPEATISDGCCAWCGIEVEQTGRREDRFCSAMCAKAYWRNREDQDGTKMSIMHRRAKRIIVRERQPERPCRCCGKPFRPHDPSQPSEFCSMSCAKLSIPDRACGCCGKVFHPATRNVKFCSRECWLEQNRAETTDRECITCGKRFQATKLKRTGFCSESCATMHRSMKNGRYVPKQVTVVSFDFFITMPINASRPAWLTPERFDEMVAA